MVHWSDIYPHNLYASVLLNENGEILNWKIVNYYWESPEAAKMSYEHMKNISKLKVCYKKFTVFNDNEHNEVFESKAISWFKQFPIAKDHIGAPPYSNKKNKNLPY